MYKHITSSGAAAAPQTCPFRCTHALPHTIGTRLPACREYHGHAKGVLGMSWCPQDATFLLSSAKDNRTICWDVNSGARSAVGAGLVDLVPTANWCTQNRTICWDVNLGTLLLRVYVAS